MIQIQKYYDSEATHSGGGGDKVPYAVIIKHPGRDWEWRVDIVHAAEDKHLEIAEACQREMLGPFQVIAVVSDHLNMDRQIEGLSAPSTPISHTQGGDGFLEWLDGEIEEIKTNAYLEADKGNHGLTSSFLSKKEALEEARFKYLSRPSQREQVGGMRWVRASERLPKIDAWEDYPQKYLIRIKGDDPRSGWIYTGYHTAEEMAKDIQGDYWEWLEEIPAPPAPTDKTLVEEGDGWFVNLKSEIGEANYSILSTYQSRKGYGTLLTEVENAINKCVKHELSSLRSQLSKMTAEKAAIKTAFEQQYIELQKLKNK